ncbi:hypothetical protein M0805_000148 [Coniferiporia weirii]|nr:hypothetical protein M0805_000148 [Coniferiporia weirii]
MVGGSARTDVTEEREPKLAVRWMRPQASSALLELPTVPIVQSSHKDVTTWQAFTAEESSKCELAWQALSDEERKLAEEERAVEELDSDDVDDDDDDEQTVGVSIAKDRLFEVDVRSMQLRPIYWKLTGSLIKIIRGTWFYDDHCPVSRKLSEKLEELYLHVMPWVPSYESELSTAFELGFEAHAKLKQKLDEARSVVFENSTKAYLVLNAPKPFLSFFPGSSNSKPAALTFYPGSTPVYRGYDAILAEEITRDRPRSSSVPAQPKTIDEEMVRRPEEDAAVAPERKNNEAKRVDHVRRRGKSAERPLPPVGNEDSEDVTDLIFIIHGIGQGLATQYEGYNFIYAANLFRRIAKKQSTSPALSSVIRNRRVQFLPVQWRTNLRLGIAEEKRREDVGLDNEFTLNDITVKNTVPYVRELMNNVLIDIPYFMSQHKEQMIKAVTKQANRIYRLWCARNPGFDVNGRVHILAHSLGSALAGHILSNQPTIQPPLSNMELSYVKGCSELFLFNTRSLFMIGSPFPLFVHINRTQTIARKGRERTVNSPSDEAFDNAGLFGCLAVDSVYNIFNPSDPIAYLLNPTVDARTAKDMPPSVVKNVNTPMFTTFSSRVSRLFEGGFSTSPKSRSPTRPPMTPGAKSGFELGGAMVAIEGTKEERRFLALNPRGTLDFVLPSEGNISGYFDMITVGHISVSSLRCKLIFTSKAHSSYWSDPNLAAFILAEIFASKEDLARTGLGVETLGLR